MWVLRIEAHEFIEENVGSRSKAHGGAGMAGIGFEGGIDLCNTDQISLTASFIELLRAWPADEMRLRSRTLINEGGGYTHSQKADGVDSELIIFIVPHFEFE